MASNVALWQSSCLGFSPHSKKRRKEKDKRKKRKNRKGKGRRRAGRKVGRRIRRNDVLSVAVSLKKMKRRQPSDSAL